MRSAECGVRGFLHRLLRRVVVGEFRRLRTAFSVTFHSGKVTKTARSMSSSSSGGESPLTIRHFDGFRYAVKMTNTAVGLSRPTKAAEACLSASVIFGKSVAFLLPWFVFGDRDKVAYIHLCHDNLSRTDLLEGEAAHGKRESQRKVEIAKISLQRLSLEPISVQGERGCS